MAELAYASDLGSEFCRFESYYGYGKRFVYTRQDRNVQNWEYRIAAIAEDCKSSLIEFSGSSPLTPTNKETTPELVSAYPDSREVKLPDGCVTPWTTMT